MSNAEGNAVVDGIEYAAAVIEFESMRAHFDLAMRCEQIDLAREFAPLLLASMQAVQDAHAQLKARLTETIERFERMQQRDSSRGAS
jgi:hypothetical protein